MASKTDAKNQQIVYSYNSYRKLSMIRYIRYYAVAGGAEDVSKRVTFTYDQPENGTGRVGIVTYTAGGRSFTETYGYTPAGLLTRKLVRVNVGGNNLDLQALRSYERGAGDERDISERRAGLRFQYLPMIESSEIFKILLFSYI